MPNAKSQMPSIAIFDYDNTLVKGDSLWPFLVAVAGRKRACLVLGKAVLGLIKERFKQKDTRTYVKEQLLLNLLGGKTNAELSPAIQSLKTWPQTKEPAITAIKKHRAAGHHILIASGSLDIYLPELLKDIPHDAVLCTQMEVKGGIVTGRMASGNCVRARKAEMIRDYLAAHGPFEDSWGYGNAPHDLPMLEWVNHKVVV